MSSSCSSRRRDHRTEPSPSATPAPAPETRDWAALPSDIVLSVFLTLGAHEVMLGAEFVCKPWRGVALDETAPWRRVGLDPSCLDPFEEQWRRGQMDMKLAAVDRANGQCQAFKGYCSDDYLLRLVERASSLRSLNIEHYSYDESGEDLVEALQKLTHLDDLEIDFKYIIYWGEKNVLHSICQACPRLKKLVLLYPSAYDLDCNDDEIEKEPIDGVIPMMCKLHTLKLCGCDLSDKGFKAILDSCPVLETLHIDGYFDKHKMDKELRVKCTNVKNLTLDTRKKTDNSYLRFRYRFA